MTFGDQQVIPRRHRGSTLGSGVVLRMHEGPRRSGLVALLLVCATVVLAGAEAIGQVSRFATGWDEVLESVAAYQDDGSVPQGVVWIDDEMLDLDDDVAVARWKRRAGVVDIQRVAAESVLGKISNARVGARRAQWSERIESAEPGPKREGLTLEAEEDARSLQQELQQKFQEALVPIIEAVAEDNLSVLLLAQEAWEALDVVDYTDVIIQQLDTRDSYDRTSQSTDRAPRLSPPPVPPARGGVGSGRLSTGSLYAATGSGHWISSVANGGRLVELEDGSLWEISAIDRIYTTLWLPITDITVIDASFPVGEYQYQLINTDDGETALAKYLGR